MGKSFFFVLAILCQYSLCIAQTINIPDTNFKNKLITADIDFVHNYAKNAMGQFIKIDVNDDDEIQQTEALQVAYLTLNSAGIIDLTGLEFFTNLTELYVGNNLLTILPLSTLTQLSIFLVSNCNLTSLNLADLFSLTKLSCIGNQIQSLDLSSNPSLVTLFCRNNNLTSINIKNGINHDFNVPGSNDCWKTGNPNLTTICVDASEQASVQSFLDGCGTAQTINITSNCGLSNEVFAKNEIVFFPNPTNAVITIRSEENINSIELYDNLGRVLVSKKVNENQTLLDVSNYSNGVYFVKVVTDNGFKIEKVIKQ